MSRALVALFALAVTLSTSLALSQTPPTLAASAAAGFTDNRPPERRKSHRDTIFAPMMVLGDEVLKPSAISRFEQMVASHGSGRAPPVVVIDDFALIDYFPGRSHINKMPSIAKAVEDDLVERHTDRALVARLGLPETGEAIVCVFTGTLNGRPVKVAAFATYKTPLTAVLVRNSASFKRAVEEAITSVAAKATQEVMAPSPPQSSPSTPPAAAVPR